MVGSGQMRLGRLGLGWVGLGRAIVADGSTEGPGSPCRHQAVGASCGATRHGEVGQGAIWLEERRGRFGALFT
jgi:hypothetical protein